MSEQDDLTRWTTTWQAEEALSEDVRAQVRKRVARDQRWWIVGAVAEVLVATIGLAVTIAVAVYSDRPSERAAMLSLAVVIVVSAAFSGWSRRGTWRPPAETTGAWLDFLLLRAQRRMEMTRYGVALLAIEVAIFIPWIAVRGERSTRPVSAYVQGYGLLLVLVVALTAWLYVTRRRSAREIAQLEQLRREIDAG